MSETLAATLYAARKALVAADIDGSALDARLLMQAVTGLTHEVIVADPSRILSAQEQVKFSQLLARRMDHEPVSRILGEREFYGRNFVITSDVLDPRADTETLVEWVLQNKRHSAGRLLDIGTGSGVLAITLLAELPHYSGVAVDVSESALHIAKQNALSNGVSSRLQFHCGDWFQGLAGKFDVVVSNPPYIPRDVIVTLETDVKDHDPHLALDGGADGLYAYRAIAAGVAAHLNDGGMIVLEIGAGQEVDVAAIFILQGFRPVAEKHDLGGLIRVLAFDYPSMKKPFGDSAKLS
jgi:release factor glutamine methyltransferase